MTRTERIIANLQTAALRLAQITDQPIDSNGMIKVNFQFASELIRDTQATVCNVAEKLGELNENNSE